MLKIIRQKIAKQHFYPGFLGVFVNPFYFSRKGLLQEMRYLAPKLTGKILDVGCGQKPYQELFKNHEYIGLEFDSPSNRLNKKADFFYDGLNFPFADKTFDSLICNQVLEHVFNPDVFISEMYRVLKPGGILLLTVPFVWDEHEQPFDYARYSSFGLASLLKKGGFSIIEQRKSLPSFHLIFQLINAFFYKKIMTKNTIVRKLIMLTVISYFNIVGILFSPLLGKNEDLYLDNVILVKRS